MDMSLFWLDQGRQLSLIYGWKFCCKGVDIMHHNGTGRCRILYRKMHVHWSRLPEWRMLYICSYHYRYSCGLCSQSGWFRIRSHFCRCSWHCRIFHGSFHMRFHPHFWHFRPLRRSRPGSKDGFRCKHRLLQNILKLSWVFPPDLMTFCVMKQF